MHIGFGHLTGCTALDVFCDKDFHVWPPVVRGNKLECFGNTGVSRGLVVMKKGNYSPPKCVVCHDNQCGPVTL